jgi:hypothetical protein
MQLKTLSIIGAAALLSISIDAVAEEPISIPAGTRHSGDLETRNESIRIGDEATIDGRLESRNGSIRTGITVTAGGVDTRNGSITLDEGGRYGDVTSRNGSIDIAAGNEVGRVETRNGDVELGANVRADSARTRNGGISIGAGSGIGGEVDSRNGRIDLAEGARVDGKIETRNGNITLTASRAGMDVVSRGGDIVLRGDAEVLGDVIIRIEENDGSSGWLGLGGSEWPEAGNIRLQDASRVAGDVIVELPAGYDEKAPTVEIAAEVTIDGSIRVDGRTELIIEETDAQRRVEMIER